jgi:hypothetical protein
MKITLIVFGVIFLILGGFLFFVPVQQVDVDTTSGSDVRTSSASITVSVGWAYASLIIGFVLLILGLTIPGNVKTVQGPRGPRGAKGKNPVRRKRRKPVASRRKSRRATLPRGTSVTTTTRIKR